MQLSKIRLNEEAKQFEFKDPFTGESFEKPIFVNVYSTRSKVAKEAKHSMQLKMIELMQDEKNVDKKDDKVQLKVELIKELSLDFISDIVVGWSGVENDKGKEIKFSKAECIKAFEECEEFMDAVYFFADNLGNYREK